MKLKLWHIDFALGLIMAGLILAAYVFDGPKDAANAIKPITCVAGDPNWICPGETRVMQVPVKPGANL